MKNRWILTEETKQKYIVSIQDFINRLENIDRETSTELLVQDFSDGDLNPYTMGELLKQLGYEEVSQDDNGWQLDYWITMTKEGYRPISVEGCGITFELKLSETDD